MTIQDARMKVLEDRVEKLESDLISSDTEKGKRMDSMHIDMLSMHQDMGALRGTVEALTEEVRSAVKSLKEIAQNTTSMKDVVDLYQKWKGFTWVIRNIGFWGAVLIAFILGVIATIIKLNV